MQYHYVEIITIQVYNTAIFETQNSGISCLSLSTK